MPLNPNKEANVVFTNFLTLGWAEGKKVSRQEVIDSCIEYIDNNITIWYTMFPKNVKFWQSVKEALINKYGN